ncbi:MAG TPA: glycerol acyltransferase [Deltaproteobacteria bacterium]|nr:MAG: hypothetical protein A2048_07695 [Deltaproteobacteria bacterium GWA2_45_12]HBF12933.1 glycerol acyltransferase [Deltaproteobacteria bacterium]
MEQPLKQNPKVLSFYRGKNRKESPPIFENLAKNLDESLNTLPQSLAQSIEMADNDLSTLINKKISHKLGELQLRCELEQFAEQLEARVQKTFNFLSIQEKLEQEEKDRLELVKNLTSQLVKVFTFDFYRNVIQSLGNQEYEEEVDLFGMDRRLIEKVKPFFDFMYQTYWRVNTWDMHHVPDEGPALIVANHSGTIPWDGSMLKVAIMNDHPVREDARFLVEDFAYHMPFLGTAMHRLGGVRACPENAELLLKAGHAVIVFPEGVKGIGKSFKNRYKLQRFGRGGFIKLAMKTKSPIVPTAVIGAEEIHPVIFKSNSLAKAIGVPFIPFTPTFPWLGLFGLIPLPAKWDIQYAPAISYEKYGEQGLNDDLLINRLSEEVRQTIQSMINKRLKKRESIWLG